MGVRGLLLLGATYAAISPWVVGVHARSGGLAVSDLIVGLALALAAMALGIAASNSPLYGLIWVAPLPGVWLIITSWVARGTDRTAGLIVSNVIVGAALVLISAAMTGVLKRGRRPNAGPQGHARRGLAIGGVASPVPSRGGCSMGA